MTWLSSLIRGLLEALLPFLFKKDPVRAEDCVQAPSDLRRSWASRITDIMRKQPESSDDPTDSVGGD